MSFHVRLGAAVTRDSDKKKHRKSRIGGKETCLQAKLGFYASSSFGSAFFLQVKWETVTPLDQTRPLWFQVT